jgi:folylpolyglutamate synthase/dihydropteroate synthase
MNDKDAASMLRILLPHASMLLATRPRTPRARDAESLAAVARALGTMPVLAVEPALAALRRAQQMGSPVLVAGSIFLIGDLLAELGSSARPV